MLLTTVIDWLKANWPAIGPPLTLLLGVLAWLINRRVSRANERATIAKAKAETAEANAGTMAINFELLQDLVKTYRGELGAMRGDISYLQERHQALEAHVADIYASIGAEPEDIASRILGRLVTKRPNGGTKK
jgi:hypothetical protein